MSARTRHHDQAVARTAWRARARHLPPALHNAITVVLVSRGNTGRSPVFAKSRALAELVGDYAFAVHEHALELLELGAPSPPASDEPWTQSQREAWASAILAHVVSKFPTKRVRLVLLMGDRLARPLLEALRDLSAWRWPHASHLLEGLPMRKRLAFLNAAIAAAKVATPTDRV